MIDDGAVFSFCLCSNVKVGRFVIKMAVDSSKSLPVLLGYIKQLPRD